MTTNRRSRWETAKWLSAIPATAAVLIGANASVGAVSGGDALKVPASQQPSAGPGSAVERLLALEVVSQGPKNSLVFDYSKDPVAAERALTEASLSLDNMTFKITGMKVKTAAESRRLDAALMADDNPIVPQKCAPEPSGKRFEGVTQTYLGCDATTGQNRLGSAFSGSPADSLKAAFTEMISVSVPAVATAAPISVTVEDGSARVNLPAELRDDLAQLAVDDVNRFYRNASFTAFSNAAVRSVQFEVGGDCQAFSLTMGGDTCGKTLFAGTAGQD